MRVVQRGIVALLCAILLLSMGLQSSVAQTDKKVVRVGVFAFQNKVDTAKRWMPLFDYLNQQIPDHDFVPNYIYGDDFNVAAIKGQFDFVFTNPASYVALTYQMNLTSPLAMLVNRQNGVDLNHFSGVVVVRADHHDIQHLADLRGKIIAATDKDSLGSFQMQAFELKQVGIDPFSDVDIVEMGQPQERSVFAALDGRADAAFVRTGIIESLVSEGKLKPDSIRIIDAQWRHDFPFLTSTRLYPEWPFAAQSATDAQLTRQVSAALLSMPSDSVWAKSIGIGGFTIPGNYRMIDDLLRDLRLPPFDKENTFTLRDIWQRWYTILIALGVLALFFILWTLWHFVHTHRLLKQAKANAEAMNEKLALEHVHLKTLVNSLPSLVWVKNDQGAYMTCNARFESLYGVSEDGLIGKTDYDFVDKDMANFFRRNDFKAITAGKASVNEELLTFADGHQELCETTKVPMFHKDGSVIGVLGIAHNITDRKVDEERLKSNERMLNRAQAVARVGSWYIDMSDGVLHWSDETYRIFAIIPGTEVTYEDFLDCVYEQDRDVVDTAWRAALAGEPYDVQHRIVVNGTIKWVRELAELEFDNGVLASATGTVQDITDKKGDEARIHQLAFYDHLTHLPNRSILMEQISQALAVARREHFMNALILLNIDRFKVVNDARGKATGDALLQAFAVRIKDVTREGDVLARIGGDEFALLITNVNHVLQHSSRYAQSVVETIQDAMRTPLMVDGETITVTVSFGITLFPEHANEHSESVLRQADTALHRAKLGGGNQIAFFEENMGESVAQSFRIERELREALQQKALRLYLQPQVDRKGRLVGAEALVRWQHPERGMIPPGIFIPVAESSDLIVDVGIWVTTEACKLLAQQEMAGLSIRLSVNLSPRHFRKPNFVEWMKGVLHDTGADASKLTLEITEGLVIDNVHDVIAKMSELHALGIHFSIDDFGTGYSSLAYIKRLPIQELKIDKTFVQDAPTDPSDAALVETILSIAQHMHLQVVAEGVETEEQAEFLNARAKVTHQGYLFGKPEPAQVWIERWQTSVLHNAAE